MHLILTQCFPPALGGIEKTMGALAGALADRGGAVRVLADGGDSPFGRPDKADGAYELERYGGWKALRQRMKARAAEGLIRAGGVQAVICDSWKSLEHLRPGPAPVACLAHGSEFPAKADAGRAARIRRALGKATVIAANSHFTAEMVRPHLGPHTELRIAVTPITPPAAPDPEALERYGALRAGGLLVACVSRLEPRKGIDRVMEAVASLGAKYPDLALLVGGAGPDAARLSEMADHLGLSPETVFLGRLSEGEKSALLQTADVFAMPARREGSSVEGYGLVYLEAGWFGAPSLAGRDGGAADAVADDRTGLLCDGASSHDVERALDRLLGDKALRRRLGEAAKARAHAETWAVRLDDFLPAAGA